MDLLGGSCPVGVVVLGGSCLGVVVRGLLSQRVFVQEGGFPRG